MGGDGIPGGGGLDREVFFFLFRGKVYRTSRNLFAGEGEGESDLVMFD